MYFTTTYRFIEESRRMNLLGLDNYMHECIKQRPTRQVEDVGWLFRNEKITYTISRLMCASIAGIYRRLMLDSRPAENNHNKLN